MANVAVSSVLVTVTTSTAVRVVAVQIETAGTTTVTSFAFDVLLARTTAVYLVAKGSSRLRNVRAVNVAFAVRTASCRVCEAVRKQTPATYARRAPFSLSMPQVR